jgi:hypothetical protein
MIPSPSCAPLGAGGMGEVYRGPNNLFLVEGLR